jgi:DNA-binding IclR family transcriptional regulator
VEFFGIENMHLDRLVRILENVAMSGGAATINDISAATGYPKPSVYRLVQDLLLAELLQAPEKGVFRIGSRLHRISRMDKSDAEISVIVEPHLAQLANEFGVACFLSRSRGDSVEITQVVVPHDKKVSFLHPGLGMRPIHACSCAKVIAAYGTESFQEDVIQRRLRQYTEFTLTEAQDLREEFQAIRDRGYGECLQELELGICSSAAPIQLDDVGVTMSVGATGSTRVFTSDFRDRIGPALIGLATDLASQLDSPVD